MARRCPAFYQEKDRRGTAVSVGGSGVRVAVEALLLLLLLLQQLLSACLLLCVVQLVFPPLGACSDLIRSRVLTS